MAVITEQSRKGVSQQQQDITQIATAMNAISGRTRGSKKRQTAISSLNR